MSKEISKNQIKELTKKFSSDQHVQIVRNAMIKTNSNELSMNWDCLLYTSPSPRDGLLSRMPSSA